LLSMSGDDATPSIRVNLVVISIICISLVKQSLYYFLCSYWRHMAPSHISLPSYYYYRGPVDQASATVKTLACSLSVSSTSIIN
jgi:hypothetical protein